MGWIHQRLSHLAWITATTASTVLAQQGPGEFLRTLTQLDVNNDQNISRGEVPEPGRDAFDRLLKHADIDKNGQIAFEEIRGLVERARPVVPGSRSSVVEGRNLQMRQADRNGDGQISQDEFPGDPMVFRRLDTNKDGHLSPEEARAFDLTGPDQAPAGMGQFERFRPMDRDGDGKIGVQEFRLGVAAFNRLDRNGDSVLDASDFPNQPRLARGVASSRNPDWSDLTRMDTDGNGRISRIEFKGPVPLFDRLDSNRDGQLSRDDQAILKTNPASDGSIPGKSARAQPRRADSERWMLMDQNQDGEIDRGDFRGPTTLFDWLDSNGDQRLSLPELSGLKLDRPVKPD